MTRSDGKPNIEGQIVADRYFAALLLGRLECRDAVPDLIRATQDDPINYRAAISLGQISDQRAIPALRKMAEECLKQRHWAGYGLALLGEQKGFDVLAEVVASSSSWTQRRHSVRALGAVGDPVATPTLIEALNDDHVNVRISAARALSKIGDPIALPALTESLNDTEVSKIHAPTTVQYEALKAMEAIAPADESRAPTLFLESDS
ncbi:MAG: HEAT repeat domain-containing protein [Planctomycetota bacterium]